MKIKIEIEIDEELLEEIDTFAKELGISRNKVFEMLLTKCLQELKNKKPAKKN